LRNFSVISVLALLCLLYLAPLLGLAQRIATSLLVFRVFGSVLALLCLFVWPLFVRFGYNASLLVYWCLGRLVPGGSEPFATLVRLLYVVSRHPQRSLFCF
jgi:hypothetical protein